MSYMLVFVLTKTPTKIIYPYIGQMAVSNGTQQNKRQNKANIIQTNVLNFIGEKRVIKVVKR